jgi:cytochrome c-type protein NapB
MKRITILATVLVVGATALSAIAAEPIATMRGASQLQENAEPPRMTNWNDSDKRQVRNYPEQPPLIPHDIDGYIVDKNSNKCLSCHSRSRTGESGAPMVSITHFMDREAQFRASVSPRRYFCNQCHVPQRQVDPMVENTFTDIDALLTDKKPE